MKATCQICSKAMRKGCLCGECRSKGWRNYDGRIRRVKTDVEACPGDVTLASPEVLVRTPSGCKVRMRMLVAVRAGYDVI